MSLGILFLLWFPFCLGDAFATMGDKSNLVYSGLQCYFTDCLRLKWVSFISKNGLV